MNNLIFRSIFIYTFLFLVKKTFYEIDNFRNFFVKNIFFREKKKFLKLFVKKNKNFWKSIENNFDDQKILISNFITTPGDIITNCTIAKYLEEKFKTSSLGILNKGDEVLNLLESYNIKKNLCLKNKSLIFKIKIYCKTFYYFNMIKSISELYNFKLNKIFIGKIVIDHIARHTGEILIGKLNFKVFYHLYEALYAHHFFLDIIKKKNIKYVVQSETQFIPCGIIFQNCLMNNIKLFAREGAPNWISNTIYSKKNEIYTARDEIDENLFKYTKKYFFKKASNQGFDIIRNRFNRKDNVNNWLISTKKNKNKNKYIHYSKNQICNLYSWDKKKKIVCIFSHLLTDGNFVMGKRLFKSNLHWLKFTLETISKNNSVNFLIKPHPQEDDYNISTNTIKELQKLGNYKHIKLVPKNISQTSLAKSIDALISSHGTAPLEYACYGVPSLMAGRGKFSFLDFFILPTKISNYKNQILKIHKLKKLKMKQIIDARIFAFIIYRLIKVKCPLVPFFKWSDNWFDYKNNFWRKECVKILNFYDPKKDYFKKMLFFQIDNKIRNMTNNKLLKI